MLCCLEWPGFGAEHIRHFIQGTFGSSNRSTLKKKALLVHSDVGSNNPGWSRALIVALRILNDLDKELDGYMSETKFDDLRALKNIISEIPHDHPFPGIDPDPYSLQELERRHNLAEENVAVLTSSRVEHPAAEEFMPSTCLVCNKAELIVNVLSAKKHRLRTKELRKWSWSCKDCDDPFVNRPPLKGHPLKGTRRIIPRATHNVDKKTGARLAKD